jgi:D-sedoheptulose 7-phosphate isomerase
MPSMPDAIVLCGGAGLRLRSITGNVPKAMVDISGRPILEILLRQLRRNGFQRVILAVCHKGDVIQAHFGAEAFGMSLEYSVETSPLGTGGALRQAADLARSDRVLVLNGDSYTTTDLVRFVVEHRETKADLAIVVVPADDRNDCGVVLVGPDGNVVGFKEKDFSSANSYVNAGIYLATHSLLYEIPPRAKLSLEEQLIPEWLARHRSIRVFVSTGKCTDIGTPERYWRAREALANVEVDCYTVKTIMKREDRQPIGRLVRRRIQQSIKLKNELLNDHIFQNSVMQASTSIIKSLRGGGKVLFFGNGGSAADAQHLAAEFTGRYLRDRAGFPALALTANSSSVTAIGNDYGFDMIFSRALEALGNAGDVAVGISTSGNSSNVLRGLQVAKSNCIYTVALTGALAGRLKGIADCTICVPSQETPRIQECHILTGHIICEIVEQALSEDSVGKNSEGCNELACTP